MASNLPPPNRSPKASFNALRPDRRATSRGPAALRSSIVGDDDAVRGGGDAPDEPYRKGVAIAEACADGEGNVGPRPTENTPLLDARTASTYATERREDADPSSKPKRLMYREELSTLMKYTLPVFGTQLFEYSLVIASVVSIGHLSTTALAASTLGSMTESVTALSIIIGFSSALDTVLPSAWTSSNPELVGLWAQRMVVILAAVLMPIFVVYFNSESILLALRQEPEVAHLASVYLKWSTIGLPAYAFNGVARRYFQSQGLFSVPTYIILVVAPINALLNYLLVWGPKPFGLGFIGAPIAGAISFNLISIASVLYAIFWVPKRAWHPLSLKCFTNLGILLKLGIAGVGQLASEWWSWEVMSFASSMLGPAALAAQSIMNVSSTTTYQAPYALSISTSVRVGNLLGEENARRAGTASNVSILMSLVISLVWSTMFMVFRNSWAYLFNDDPEVVGLVAQLLPLVALFQVFDGLTGVTGGILRARGLQSVGALLNFSAYYLLGIPIGLWLTFRHGMHLEGLWIGLTISMVCCATVGVWLCVRTNWQYEVDKVQKRLEADKARARVEDAEAQN